MKQTDAVGYCRLSEAVLNGSSIASQKKRIVEYCQRYNLNLLKIFVDDGKSGWTFDRPGFIELEQFCKQNKQARLLIIPHFDRFSRADPIDAMVKERYFRDKLNVKVLQLSEPPDTDTNNSTYQIIRFMQAFAANEERNRIVDRVTTAIHYKLLQGRYCSTAPYGYKNTRDPQGQAVIVIDETKSAVVKFILKQYLKGYNIEELRTLAIEKGFSVKGHSAIQKILLSPVYAGLINVPAYKNQPAKLVKGIHSALISEGEYWQIQQRLAPHKFLSVKRPEVPLRGVLKCFYCEKMLTAAPSKSKLGRYYWYYFCNTHRKENFSAIRIHGQLDDILDAISIKGEYFDRLKEKLYASIQELISTQTKELMKLNLQVRSVEQTISFIEEKYLLESVSRETYNKVMGEKKTFLAELNTKKEMLNFGAHDYLGRLDKVMEKAGNVRTLYNQMNVVSKQSFIKQVFGTDLRYTLGSYRTPFLHPVFAMIGRLIKDLPLIIEKQKAANHEKFFAVNDQGAVPNPIELIESFFEIFAA